MKVARAGAALFNPGPVVVHPAVRAALAGPDLCHREPDYADLARRVQQGLVRVAGGDQQWAAVVLTGSGTAALESVLSSVVPEEGRVLVLSNGNYGDRVAEVLLTHAVPVDRIDVGWAVPFDLGGVREHLRRTRYTHVAVVHHETSTGMLNPVHELGQLCAEHGVDLIVDAISSLGAEELRLTSPGLTWVVASSNKCLEGEPGLSAVLGRHAAFRGLEHLPRKTVYLDLLRHYRAQHVHAAPAFTPAVPAVRALLVAIELLEAEGGPLARRERYARLTRRVRQGFQALGIEAVVPAAHASHCLTAFRMLPGLSYGMLHEELRRRNLVIYAGQGELARSTFRVATMGQLTPDDVADLIEGVSAVVADREEPPAHD